ncbi:patatin family protein [Candidatus Falkowbacteria bacterium]|nr:MAG: patatin family protein [Candidatus Falkowbacteria bacterium]
MKNKKIGLALGAGGARGIAHIGVLKALEKANIKVNFISGASMGALVGAAYAIGMSAEEIEKEALKNKKRITKFIDFNRPSGSILKGKKAAKYINELLKDKNFNDTIIPFRVIATDLETGNEVIIKKGKLTEAVMASISVPGIFPPVKVGKKYLIDGGVVNPTPIDVVKNMGADIIIGVDLIMRQKLRLVNPGLITTIMQTYEIMRTQAVKQKIKNLGEETIIIKPKTGNTIDSYKFKDVGKFIREGELAAQNAIPKIREKLE